jgi:hypothetical protein
MKFKVGDVCIGQGFVHCTDMNGNECVVIGELEWALARNIPTGEYELGWYHKVRWAQGDITFQEPASLRLKKPPEREQTIPWSECIWKPAGVTA